MNGTLDSLRVSAVILPLCGVLLHATPATAQKTYHVSQSCGNDGYDGRATTWDGKHGPWKTLVRASAATYQAGDKLLLKCGDGWQETLTLHGNGSTGNPVTVASYDTGERPAIRRSTGNRTACVILDKVSGYRISDLEMSFAQNAIRIAADSRVTTALGDYRIENCFLHDIANPTFPDPAKNEGRAHNDYRNMGWAIFVDGYESPGPVHLKNLTVRNCIGLHTQGFFMPMGRVSLEDISFDGNTIAHNSFNSVYQIAAKRFNILNSVFVYSYPWEFHPNGSTQVLAGGVSGDMTVRNEVRNNEFGWAGDYPGCPDGCAYDFEGSTSGVTFQNNFVHDTFGEAVLFMGRCQHKDLIFDGNLFRNNVRFSPRWDVEVTLFPDDSGNGTFSNNTFFPRPGKRTINSKPACFTFTGNDETAVGTFVDLPLVTRVDYSAGMRTYTLSSRTPGATIRYTRDGSLPTASSTPCTGPITVRRSGVLNAKAFKAGSHASYVNSVVVELRDQEGAGPAAWWKLDEGTGHTATDSVGGDHGSISGCRWTGGRINGGLELDGVKDSLSIASARLMSISDTFTISFWARPRATRAATKESNSGTAGITAQRYALFPKHLGSGGNAGAGVSVGTNGISVYEHAADYLPPLLVGDFPLSGWNHIVVVYRNRQPTLYLNGVYEKAGCKSTKTVHPVFDLGGSDYGWYGGTLDDIRVYNRALTDAEIQVLAQTF
jgi:Concanavalin A-like lectin/glucanases superfamily/Chitobiase/beta-hexosaminidase C-terminal domain/Right handed beta helix region